MAVIQSLGSIALLQPPNWWAPSGRTQVNLYNEYFADYATLYREQPNVRVCVDFMARNIAQLGLHTFRRIGETDRQRVRDHGLPILLGQPLPPEMKVTPYRMIEAMVSDLGIYFNAYWLKLRAAGAIGGLLRVPPMYVTPRGGLAITDYRLNIAGREFIIPPADIVHFKGYNPESAVTGLSPLETLRRVLAEEYAAGNYRESFWRNSAKTEGIIERPKDAPDWGADARERFLAEFNSLYAGDGPMEGGTVVLEDGMKWVDRSFNARESEYILGRKLTREECGRSYHLPLPMIGILDHATFSNIKEQHKHLYQDALGPTLAMIEDDIELQLMPEFPDVVGMYVEFNIAEKLAGSFEEQMTAMQTAVGGPIMTPNEARARLNLPSLPGGDELAKPTASVPAPAEDGGGDGASDTDPNESEEDDDSSDSGAKAKRYNPVSPALRSAHQERWTRALTRHYRRQEAAVVSRVPKAIAGSSGKAVIAGVWFDEDRWNEELTADLFALNRTTSLAFADALVDRANLDIDDMERFEERMLPWLQEHSRIQAEGINASVREGVRSALDDPNAMDAVKHLFEVAVSAWAIQQAISAVTSAASFGSTEAAQAGGLRSKTWRTHSGNSRPSHAAIDGMTIGLRELFPTGQRWPGDPSGGAEENSNCECSVEFS